MGDSGSLCIGFILGANDIHIRAEHGSIAGFIPFAFICFQFNHVILWQCMVGFAAFLFSVVLFLWFKCEWRFNNNDPKVQLKQWAKQYLS